MKKIYVHDNDLIQGKSYSLRCSAFKKAPKYIFQYKDLHNNPVFTGTGVVTFRRHTGNFKQWVLCNNTFKYGR